MSKRRLRVLISLMFIVLAVMCGPYVRTSMASELGQDFEQLESQDPEALAAPRQECANRWHRLAGSNAVGTMKAIVNEGFASAGTVVVATSASFKDALAAASLAGKENAPILLTNPTKLPATTQSEISRLKASKVIIVGGVLAVSEGVESALKALPSVSVVERIAGKNAPDTARKIAAKAKTSSWVIIATSRDFADALSIAPWSFANTAPIILLESKGALSQSSMETIAALKAKNALIVGGEKAVPASVANELAQKGLHVERLGGSSAVDTSRLIA